MPGPTSINMSEVTLPEAVAYVGGLFSAFHAVATKLQEVAGQAALDEIEKSVLANIQGDMVSAGFPGHPNAQKGEAATMVQQAFRATRNAFDNRSS